MGNSVSAHIYETKVFRPYPDSDFYPLGKKIGVFGTTKWRTRGSTVSQMEIPLYPF